MNRERGFSLLEVIIAVALVGIVAVAIYAGLATASKTAITTDERATAESLARSQMEEMKKLAYRKVNLTTGEATYTDAKITLSGYVIKSINSAGVWDNSTDIIGIAWNSTTGNPVPTPIPVTTDVGLQKIKLRIYHNSKPLFTLEDYKVDR